MPVTSEMMLRRMRMHGKKRRRSPRMKRSVAAKLWVGAFREYLKDREKLEIAESKAIAGADLARRKCTI